MDLEDLISNPLRLEDFSSLNNIHSNFTQNNMKLDEDEISSKWYSHKLHVLIFTNSGKPVYSRYGSENQLSSFTGTLSVIMTTMQSLFLLTEEQDTLRHIKAGKYIFVFLQRGPLWLTAISSQGEVFSQLEALLNNVHLQIISLLTRSIDQTLFSQPSFDVCQLLGGTKHVIFNYISWHCIDMFSLVKGYEPLPLNPNFRSIASNILKEIKSPNILAAIMIANHRIVAITLAKNITLLPSDLTLLFNLILSSASLRQAESWTPVCLPGFNDEGFLYAYVNFLIPDSVGIIYLSTNSDGEQFYLLSEHFKRIMQLMSTTNCLRNINDSLSFCPYPIDENLKLYGIIHFLFFSTSLQQYFSSRINPTYYTKINSQKILQFYSRCNYLIQGMGIPSQVQIKGIHETIYLIRNTDFHLYIFCPRWKEISNLIINQIIDWIKSKMNFFFIVSPPLLKN